MVGVNWEETRQPLSGDDSKLRRSVNQKGVRRAHNTRWTAWLSIVTSQIYL
jgi:hypothetical protein